MGLICVFRTMFELMTRLSSGSRSVAGKVVVVTGAGSGMGRSTAHLFADEGARVAVTDERETIVQAVVDEIVDAHGSSSVLGFVLDVTDRDAISRTVSEIVSAWGGVDILVNNAGISIGLPIDHPEHGAAWSRTLAVNLTAHADMIKACLGYLKVSSEGGRIINIASTEGLGATSGISPYTAAKHGVVGLTRSLAVELAPQNVTVNCVCPGPINTGMTMAIPDDMKRKFARRRVPMRRYGEPEEVAHATLNFALPASSFMTGAILPVDGGMVCQNT